jgi:hypothetical protein
MMLRLQPQTGAENRRSPAGAMGEHLLLKLPQSPARLLL